MAKEHPRYSGFDWPDWEFQEFPMMLYPGAADPRKPEYHPKGHPKSGQLTFPGVIVQDQDEAKALLGGGETVATPGGGERLKTEADTREALFAEATALGITYDKKWSSARIEDAIATAKTAAHATVV